MMTRDGRSLASVRVSKLLVCNRLQVTAPTLAGALARASSSHRTESRPALSKRSACDRWRAIRRLYAWATTWSVWSRTEFSMRRITTRASFTPTSPPRLIHWCVSAKQQIRAFGHSSARHLHHCAISSGRSPNARVDRSVSEWARDRLRCVNVSMLANSVANGLGQEIRCVAPQHPRRKCGRGRPRTIDAPAHPRRHRTGRGHRRRNALQPLRRTNRRHRTEVQMLQSRAAATTTDQQTSSH